jgi:hypothetical protein
MFKLIQSCPDLFADLFAQMLLMKVKPGPLKLLQPFGKVIIHNAQSPFTDR